METTCLGNPEKDKAIALIKKFYVDALISFESAKICAILMVNEILEEIDWHITDIPYGEIAYWKEVKKELEKL
jgi:hypothetical protein